MITGEIKNKVDQMWEYFWTGGLTNPIDVIEQLTYLMFMKRLDIEQMSKEKTAIQSAALLGIQEDTSKYIYQKDKEYLRWSRLLDNSKAHEIIRNDGMEFLKTLSGDEESAYSKYMKNAVYKVPSAKVLKNTMDVMEDIFSDESFVKDRDAKGDLYEYLLSKLSISGTNGQFRTPKHIINMMVELMKPTPEDTIIDPACGTAGFLASSVDYLMRNYKNEIMVSKDKRDHFNQKAFNGNDTDATMLGISAMNLMLHNVENPNLYLENSLSVDYKKENEYSLVLANPPFKGSLDYEDVNSTLLEGAKTKKTELLFLRLITRILKIGGRAAVIIPDGVLFGSSNAHKSVREEIIEKHKLEAVISMPSGVFKPYAGVSTGILIFTKTGDGGTDKVWFYDMTADGYSLDDKRNPIEENDIPDIIERFGNLDKEVERKRTEKSFFVPVSEIKGNNYDLSLNRYKEVEYEEVEYAKPSVILSEIKELEKKITEGIQALEAMLEV